MTSSFVVQFIDVLGNVLYLAMLGRVILSWVNLGPSNPIVAIVYQITEPILAPIRAVLPRMGSLDFSPMVAMLAIWLVRNTLTGFFE